MAKLVEQLAFDEQGITTKIREVDVRGLAPFLRVMTESVVSAPSEKSTEALLGAYQFARVFAKQKK